MADNDPNNINCFDNPIPPVASNDPVIPPTNDGTQPPVYTDPASNIPSQPNPVMDEADVAMIENIITINNTSINSLTADTNTNFSIGGGFAFSNKINNDLTTKFYDKYLVNGFFTITATTASTVGSFYVSFKVYDSFTPTANIIFQDDKLYMMFNNGTKKYGVTFLLPRHGRISIDINNKIGLNTCLLQSGKLIWTALINNLDNSA